MSEKGPSIPEFARKTTMYESDPVLSQLAETAQKNRSHDEQFDYVSADHVDGDPVVGLPINKDYNKGLQHGPWKASPQTEASWMASSKESGLTLDDVQRLNAAIQTSRSVGLNTYPFSSRNTESESIEQLANEEYKDILRTASDRVRGAIHNDK